MRKSHAGELYYLLHLLAFIAFIDDFQILRRAQRVLPYFHLVSADSPPKHTRIPMDSSLMAAWAAFIIYYVYCHLLCLLMDLEQIRYFRHGAPAGPFIIHCVYCRFRARPRSMPKSHGGDALFSLRLLHSNTFIMDFVTIP